MVWLVGFVKREPVRCYSVLMALCSLAAYFVPSGAWPLLLAVFAATLGQGVRSQVTPYVPD